MEESTCNQYDGNQSYNLLNTIAAIEQNMKELPWKERKKRNQRGFS